MVKIEPTSENSLSKRSAADTFQVRSVSFYPSLRTGEGTRKTPLTPLISLWEKGLGDEGDFLTRTHANYAP